MTQLDAQVAERTSPRTRDVAVVAATLAVAGVTWLLLTGPLGVSLVATVGGERTEVGIGAVLVSTLVAGTAAAVLLRVLESRLNRGRAVWAAVAGVTLLVSFAGAASGATTGAVLGLGLLHVVVAASLVGGLLSARRG